VFQYINQSNATSPLRGEDSVVNGRAMAGHHPRGEWPGMTGHCTQLAGGLLFASPAYSSTGYISPVRTRILRSSFSVTLSTICQYILPSILSTCVNLLNYEPSRVTNSRHADLTLLPTRFRGEWFFCRGQGRKKQHDWKLHGRPEHSSY